MGWRPFCVVLAPVAWCVAAFPPGAAMAAARRHMAQAVAALRAITTLHADFVQSDLNGGQVKGVMWLKRPGKICFQYAAGLSADDAVRRHALFMIDKQVNQTQRWPINNSPLGALLNPNKDVTQFGGVLPHGPGVVAVEVRTGSPEFGTTTLVFRRKGGAPGGMELESWITRDAQNRQTRIELTNQQYGVNAPEDSSASLIQGRGRINR
jgi:outer membrane lipoprotein-sorting protein